MDSSYGYEKMAILVDGGFYRRRAFNLFGDKTPGDRANELVAYCSRHIDGLRSCTPKRPNKENESLHVDYKKAKSKSWKQHRTRQK